MTDETIRIGDIAHAPIDGCEAIFCDLDGCLVSGGHVYPNVREFVANHADRLWIVSNNSSDTAETLSSRINRGRRRYRGNPARRDRLRCRQADRLGSCRAPSGQARSRRLSASAKDGCEDDIGGRLRRPHSRESGMTVKGTVDAMPAQSSTSRPDPPKLSARCSEKVSAAPCGLRSRFQAMPTSMVGMSSSRSRRSISWPSSDQCR